MWPFNKRPTAEEATFTLYCYRHSVRHFADMAESPFIRDATSKCLRLMLGREPTAEEIDAANDDTRIPF